MDYQAILLALLPDLIVVVALFAALGVDYGYLRGASMNKRAGTALQICSVGLIGALALLVAQAVLAGGGGFDTLMMVLAGASSLVLFAALMLPARDGGEVAPAPAPAE